MRNQCTQKILIFHFHMPPRRSAGAAGAAPAAAARTTGTKTPNDMQWRRAVLQWTEMSTAHETFISRTTHSRAWHNKRGLP